jgi:hypothetical protein
MTKKIRKKLKVNSKKNPDGILGKYPKVPVVYEAFGNKELARQKFGYGRKLLHDMSVKLGYNDIKAGAAASQRHEYQDGSVIDLQINHGLSKVTVYIPEESGDEANFKPACFPGFRCFIFATIEKVTCSEPAPEPPECDIYNLSLSGERFLYDVSFCYLDRYVLLHNYMILSAGWERYRAGQYVLLGPDAYTVGQCCADGRDLASVVLDENSGKMRHGHLDVYPVHITGDMVKKDIVMIDGL